MMMKIFKKRNTTVETDLKLFESKMREYLQPLQPRPEFVDGLYTRLVSSDLPETPKLLIGNGAQRLLIAGGIIGSVLMVITSVRGLVSLLGFLGLIVQYIQRNGRRQQVKPA
jgi:hypothetical protein